MSGASALAAAKRRRAVPSEPTRPTSVQSKPNQLPKPPSQLQSQGQASQPQNPLYLLLQHEQKLDNLEKSLNLLSIPDKKEKEVLTPDSLNYFKTQQELMSKEIQELKKIIIKVQTFSMETNLDLLKIKKTLKLIDSNDVTENVA